MPVDKTRQVQRWRDVMTMYLTIAANPGLRIPELARATGIPFDRVKHEIASMDRYGYRLTEDEEKLYVDKTSSRDENIKLPDDLTNLLMQLAGNIDKNYWELGDVVDAVVTEFSPYRKKASILGELSKWTGMLPTSLRDARWMSTTVSPAKRREYAALSRHQIRACLGAGDQWEEFAQRALKSAEDYGGRMPPIVVIRDWVKGTPGQQREVWRRMTEKLYDLLEDLAQEEDAPAELRAFCASMLLPLEAWK